MAELQLPLVSCIDGTGSFFETGWCFFADTSNRVWGRRSGGSGDLGMYDRCWDSSPRSQRTGTGVSAGGKIPS